MAVLSMLRGLATEPLRNAHNAWRKQTSSSFSLSSWSNSFSFILTALNLSVWQDSSWSDMSALSGETTTTNGFDGRIFSFLVRATTIAIWSDNRDYYTLSSLSLFWLAESVQWIFEISACDVITADYTIIMSRSRVIMSRSRVIMSCMTAVLDFKE